MFRLLKESSRRACRHSSLQGGHGQTGSLPNLLHGRRRILIYKWIAFMITHGTLQAGVSLFARSKARLFDEGRTAGQVDGMNNHVLKLSKENKAKGL